MVNLNTGDAAAPRNTT